MTSEKIGIKAKSVHSKIGAEIAGLGVAEFLSGVTSIGVFALADEVAPGAVKAASKALSKLCVEDNLESIEGALGKFCKLEECKPDLSKSREQRAEELAETVIKFGASFAATMVVKLASRKYLNDSMGLSHEPHAPTGNWFKDKVLYKHLNPHDWKVFLADESVHLGSFFMVNNGAAKHTDAAIQASSSVLQKLFGWNKEKSNESKSNTRV